MNGSADTSAQQEAQQERNEFDGYSLNGDKIATIGANLLISVAMQQNRTILAHSDKQLVKVNQMSWCFVGPKILLNTECGSVVKLRRGSWDKPIDIDFNATPALPDQQKHYFRFALREAQTHKEAASHQPLTG